MWSYLFLPNNGHKSKQHIIREHSKQIGKSGNSAILFTIPHKTQHTVGPTMSTCVSFTSIATETIRKAFKGVKQHPETPKNTVASCKDIQLMEQPHEKTYISLIEQSKPTGNIFIQFLLKRKDK